MQHFRGADAVNDFAAKVGRPALANVARQRFAGRRTQAQRDLGLGRQVRAGQHAAVAGGRPVKHRGLVVDQAFESGLWRGALGHQHHRGTRGQREGQGVTQTVGKKQLGRRKHHIALAQCEYAFAIQLGRPIQIALGVHRALGLTGRAGRVKPESRFVGQGGRGQGGQSRLKGGPVGHVHCAWGQGSGRARHHQVLHLMSAQSQGGLQSRQQCARDQGRLGAAVGQHKGIVVGGEQGVDGHRHHAGVERAQKGHDPIAAVVHQQKHTLFTLQTQTAQASGKALHLQGQVAVAERAHIVNDRRFAGARPVGQQQVLGKVEFFGRCHRLSAGHGRSLYVGCIKKLVEWCNWLYKCIILRMSEYAVKCMFCVLDGMRVFPQRAFGAINGDFSDRYRSADGRSHRE